MADLQCVRLSGNFRNLNCNSWCCSHASTIVLMYGCTCIHIYSLLIGSIYLYGHVITGESCFVADFRRLKSKLRVYQKFAYVVYGLLNGRSISLQLVMRKYESSAVSRFESHIELFVWFELIAIYMDGRHYICMYVYNTIDVFPIPITRWLEHTKHTLSAHLHVGLAAGSSPNSMYIMLSALRDPQYVAYLPVISSAQSIGHANGASHHYRTHYCWLAHLQN